MKEKPIDLQPEVLNPELFPHILPPDDIAPNSDLPTEKEVEDARKRFKNGKCQGTDKIYGEELKYNFSGRFMIYLMLLINIVWTSFKLPSSWLISSITCLFNPTYHGVFGHSPVTGGGTKRPPLFFFWVALFDGVFF